MTRGRVKMILDGGWCGGPPPYGLRFAEVSEESETRVEIDPTRAQGVRLMSSMTLGGATGTEIAEELTRQSVPKAVSGEWSAHGISMLLLRHHRAWGGTHTWRPGSASAP